MDHQDEDSDSEDDQDKSSMPGMSHGSSHVEVDDLANQAAWEADFEDPDYDKNLVEEFIVEGPQGQSARNWKEAKSANDAEIVAAFLAEVSSAIDTPGANASIFEPAPSSLREIFKMKDTRIREAWLKAYYKEIQVSNYFGHSLYRRDVAR